MRLARRAAKRDETEPAIIEALEKAGWEVHTEMPCDAFCFKAGVWKALEIKTPRNKRGDPRIDKRQVEQNAFLERTKTPRICSPEAALEALK